MVTATSFRLQPSFVRRVNHKRRYAILRPASQAGFSLVELAIVLIIIGLIVGGVLKGQDLIESARVNSIQTQLNEIRTAATTFLNKYDDLPGDMPEPELFTGVPFSGGDGDGRIDEGDRIGADPDPASDPGAPGIEPTAFWYHLVVAELISGLDSACTTTADETTCTFGGDDILDGEDALQSRLDGYFTVKWDEITDVVDENNFISIENHWIQLGGDGEDGGDTDGANDGAVLTPIQLRTIDQRGDDGRPETGSILGFGAENEDGTGVSCRRTGADENAYSPNDLTPACVGAFRL